MGVLVRKQRGLYYLTGIAKLAIVGLIVSLASAYVDTIWAVYLDSFLNSAALVGFVSAGLTLISFASYFFFIPIIEKRNKAKVLSFSLFLFAVTYILFAFNKNLYVFLGLAVLMTLLYSLRITSLGILVRDHSERKKLSRNEGFVYTLTNLAWVLGPLVAGYIAAGFGIGKVFILAAVFVFAGFLLFQFAKVDGKKGKKKVDGDVVKNFIDFFKSRDRRIAYFVGVGSTLWWSLIYLFMPLLILDSGLGDLWIGYFLFAVAVPLILFEYYFSEVAGRRGFLKMFKAGYAILAIMAFVCFFVSDIYLLMGLLILASIGNAMIEPTTEAYFFDVLKEKEEYRFYGPYNTAVDTGSFIGKIFPAILLLFLPFRFIFLLFAGFMFLFFLLSLKVRRIVEEKRK